MKQAKDSRNERKSAFCRLRCADFIRAVKLNGIKEKEFKGVYENYH